MRYEMFSVFQVKPGALSENRPAAIAETRTFFNELATAGVTLRGLYEIAGLRADADRMMWTLAERVVCIEQCVPVTVADLRGPPS